MGTNIVDILFWEVLINGISIKKSNRVKYLCTPLIADVGNCVCELPVHTYVSSERFGSQASDDEG